MLDRRVQFNANQFNNLVQSCSSQALRALQDHICDVANHRIRESINSRDRKIEASKDVSFWLNFTGGGFLGAGLATTVDSTYLALGLYSARVGLMVATAPSGAIIAAFCFGGLRDRLVAS